VLADDSGGKKSGKDQQCLLFFSPGGMPCFPYFIVFVTIGITEGRGMDALTIT